MEKRTAQEKEKYQPSYDTTILSEVSVMQSGKTGAPAVFSNLSLANLFESKVSAVRMAVFQSGNLQSYNFL